MFERTLDTEHVFANDAHVARTPAPRRRRRMLILGCVVALAVWVAGEGAHAIGSRQPPAPASYVVRPGDSLWSIAVRWGRGRDPREVVDLLEHANQLDGPAIVPGQVLRIPDPA